MCPPATNMKLKFSRAWKLLGYRDFKTDFELSPSLLVKSSRKKILKSLLSPDTSCESYHLFTDLEKKVLHCTIKRTCIWEILKLNTSNEGKEAISDASFISEWMSRHSFNLHMLKIIGNEPGRGHRKFQHFQNGASGETFFFVSRLADRLCLLILFLFISFTMQDEWWIQEESNLSHILTSSVTVAMISIGSF